jgi:peptidoglycan/xylan/chitin deacetylase (PgdA/CDA1 family)
MTLLPRLLDRIRFARYVARDEGFPATQYTDTLARLRQDYRVRGWSDGFPAYEALVAGLRDLPGLDVVPLASLGGPAPTGRTVLALRFDIDADPETGIRLARYNARYGLPGTFFLLHTAYYYGASVDGTWCRNAGMIRDWVRAFVLAGAEVGLHIDPLGVYATQGSDGAAAVRTELGFLRSCGARVVGTVSHNSLPVYGAENFEVFRGQTVWARRSVTAGGRRVRLGTLDMAGLGLSYEANFARPVTAGPTAAARAWLAAPLEAAANREDWMRNYLLDNPCYSRAYEVTVWHHGGGAWTIAGRAPTSVWRWKVSQPEMLATLRSLPIGLRIALVMHPIGFSADRV